MRIAIGALAVVMLFGLLGWWHYSLWAECRQTNSFFYCVRVLNK